MIKSINHITYNTNHRRDSLPTEVGGDTLEYFKDKILKMHDSGIELFDGVECKLTLEGEGTYVATLYAKDDMPIFTTAGTSNPQKVKYVWDNLRKVNDAVNPSSKIVPLPSQAPFCVDLLLPAMVTAPSVATWTDDFSRCLAWAVLSPESIQQVQQGEN